MDLLKLKSMIIKRENINSFLIKFNKRKYIRVLYTEKTTLN
jgi:hypothetical protein